MSQLAVAEGKPIRRGHTLGGIAGMDDLGVEQELLYLLLAEIRFLRRSLRKNH
jgi:hypothetical protein